MKIYTSNTHVWCTCCANDDSRSEQAAAASRRSSHARMKLIFVPEPRGARARLECLRKNNLSSVFGPAVVVVGPLGPIACVARPVCLLINLFVSVLGKCYVGLTACVVGCGGVACVRSGRASHVRSTKFNYYMAVISCGVWPRN